MSFLISNLQNLSSISDRLCFAEIVDGRLRSSCRGSPRLASSPSVIWDEGVSRPKNYFKKSVFYCFEQISFGTEEKNQIQKV